MQSTRSSHSPRGLPLWTLWAALPVALSMGFVTGLALVHYAPEPSQPPPVVADGAEQQPEPEPVGSGVPDVTEPAPGGSDPSQDRPGGTPPEPDFSWRIVPTAPPEPDIGEPVLEPDLPPPVVSGPSPTIPRNVYGSGGPRDIREARETLAREFALYATEEISFRVEYQQMRHAGTGKSLVGMLSVEDYPHWERALREEPDALQAWLEQAAGRVQAAAIRDGFHLSWAVVDTVGSEPLGFAAFEVTPLSDGTYLVIRPLAATMDHASTHIALRPLGSLSLAASGQRASMGSPWAIYGPVVRFDNTDIYLPFPPGVKPETP